MQELKGKKTPGVLSRRQETELLNTEVAKYQIKTTPNTRYKINPKGLSFLLVFLR